MTKREINIALAAILSTLAETNGGPESMIYLALGADLQKWHVLRDMLAGAGLIEVDRASYVTITAKGRELAAKIDAARAAA